MRGRWAIAALALIAVGCDNVSEEEKQAALDAIQAHADALNLEARSGGFYAFAPENAVRHVNLSHSPIGERKHGVSIWIVQNDQDRPGPNTVTDARQVLANEPAFFRANICPPPEVMARYQEDFEIYLNLFSRKFEQQFKIPCE